MRQTLFAILLAIGLSACAGEFDPDGIEGSATGIGMGTTGDESDGTDGTDGGTSGDEGTDGGSTGADTDGGSEGSTGGDEERNPTLGEPCDPMLAFAGVEPCEWLPGEEEAQDLTCSLINVPEGMYMPKGARCMRLTDTQGDGNDIGEPCELGDDGPDHYSCFNSWCVNDNTYPQDPSQGEWILPQGFCPDNGSGACCTMFCEQTSDCDTGMHCRFWKDTSLEMGLAPLGICLDDEYTGWGEG